MLFFQIVDVVWCYKEPAAVSHSLYLQL